MLAWLEDQCHPIVAQWFRGRFQKPSLPQVAGWPAISKGQNTLIAAPTGSGKTLSAFLVAIDALVKKAVHGQLKDKVQVLYISPLKALSNDINLNLQGPLSDISSMFEKKGHPPLDIRIGLRTGDTPSHKRQAMYKNPPHILVTTPESLYLLLTASKSRAILDEVETVIVDEIHAMAGDKRGSHLALSLARLDGLVGSPPVRIGLSATMEPIVDMAKFLTGLQRQEFVPCELVKIPSRRDIDLEVVTPDRDLGPVLSHEGWDELYEKLTRLINEHRGTLVFVNTRRMAERLTQQLSSRLGKGHVKSHHGSLSKERRYDAEKGLKEGRVKAIVATASMELGIDVGFIDLVCQIGSPRSIGTFIQRIGRSGHSLSLIPKGRLFALTRDELIEAAALIYSVNAGVMDAIQIPECPLDILAQQIVASVAVEEWDERQLFLMLKNAYPFRDLAYADYESILGCLSQGMSPRTRRGSYIHWDKTHGKLRPRPSARLTATCSGGAIPEQNTYRVVTSDDDTFVGTVDEDFAIESMRGDIFLLGNQSWQIERVYGAKVMVHDAQGAAPSIPFWFGEAPGRSFELSKMLSHLRILVAQAFESTDPEEVINDIGLVKSRSPKIYDLLIKSCGLKPRDGLALIQYIRSQVTAIGAVPSMNKVIFERFFDDTEGMQVVVHAPFGARINRAFGLALRKKFCRSFDFELQALADDNGVVLSTGPHQSFKVENLFNLVTYENLKQILIQALLAVPMFTVRWRWNLTRSLAVLRHRGGKRVPPNLQRFQADDILTAVFPAQTQCAEHQTGDIEIPEHPLVRQTIEDCLYEAMDFDRLVAILKKQQEGKLEFVAKTTREPSPFAHELLNANPYAFLDDAPLEERRARAVQLRRTLNLTELRNLTQLSPVAIDQVKDETKLLVRNPDECFDALMQYLLLPKNRFLEWQEYFEHLLQDGRILEKKVDDQEYFFPLEHEFLIARALAGQTPEEPVREIVLGWLETLGPTCLSYLGDFLPFGGSQIERAFLELENEGRIVQGTFDQRLEEEAQWCERRLLFRIHSKTVKELREKIKPVSLEAFQYFLAHLHGCYKEKAPKGVQGLKVTLNRLEGFVAPLREWESEILLSRVCEYEEDSLDQVGGMGEWLFHRTKVSQKSMGVGYGVHKGLSLSFFRRRSPCLSSKGKVPPELSGEGELILEVLGRCGALFYDELLERSKLLPTRLDRSLSELFAQGMIHFDRFQALRAFEQSPAKRSKRQHWHEAGRFSLVPFQEHPYEDVISYWVDVLFRRYGILFRELLNREPLAPKWRDLVPKLRDLELKGEVYGGRYVIGVSGDQYALKEAADELRKYAHEEKKCQTSLILAAADPINLSTLYSEGREKIPQVAGMRLAMCGGVIIAKYSKKEGFIPLKDDLEGSFLEELHFNMRLDGRFRSQLAKEDRG